MAKRKKRKPKPPSVRVVKDMGERSFGQWIRENLKTIVVVSSLIGLPSLGAMVYAFQNHWVMVAQNRADINQMSYDAALSNYLQIQHQLARENRKPSQWEEQTMQQLTNRMNELRPQPNTQMPQRK